MNKTILSLFAAAACAATSAATGTVRGTSEASRPYSFSNEKALPAA